jgi:hypothetical protein
VKEGWGPLCEHFLLDGKSCPQHPFPNVNSKDSGFLVDLRLTMQTKIDLYRIHALLARDWLVTAIVFCRQNLQALL